MIEEPACQTTCMRPRVSMRTARTPSVHGTYTVLPTTAVPPNEVHSCMLLTWPPIPPWRDWRST